MAVEIDEDTSESLAIPSGICASGTLPVPSSEATPSIFPTSDCGTYVVAAVFPKLVIAVST
jgi:hypothetical protein